MSNHILWSKSNTISNVLQDKCNVIVIQELTMRRLLKEDFDKPCQKLSRYLLGKILVRKLENGTILKGRIVETESYLGEEDKASHSYNGRRTTANEAMYMPAGTVYIYIIYGRYHCLNISSKEPGAAVLLRALEPICGIEIMQELRGRKKKTDANDIKTSKICAGPSKLCFSMGITKENINKIDLTNLENDKMWLEDDPDHHHNIVNMRVVCTSRIGVASAGVEWAIKPLRFYILNNDNVSKRDRAAEEELELV